MEPPDISVVIPTSGRLEVLERCLQSLLKQEYANFEVIIVSNLIGGLEDLAEKYNTLKISLIEEKGKGLTTARNSGLSAAKGKIVSFIDDDVTAEQGWLREIVNTFNRENNIGGVSGPTIIPQELINNRDILAFQNKIKKNIFWRIIGKFYAYFVLENSVNSIGRIFKSGAFSLGSNYADSAKINTEINVDYLEASNMSFKKDALDKAGKFSLEYKGLGDWSEPDLAFRIKKEGYRLIFNPKAAVNHRVSQQGIFKERGRDSCQRMKNFIHFYFKWIKPDTLDKLIRFSCNITFVNLYWLYKFFLTGNINWLSGIKGTFSGLEKELCRS